jgi:ketopantoate reductase
MIHTINIASIGCGEMGCLHAEVLQNLPNAEIARPKFGTTPQAVLNDQVQAQQQERQQRMADLKVKGGTSRPRIEDKVVATWKKMAAKMTTNQLFAFRELLNQRYRAIQV